MTENLQTCGCLHGIASFVIQVQTSPQSKTFLETFGSFGSKNTRELMEERSACVYCWSIVQKMSVLWLNHTKTDRSLSSVSCMS